MQVKAWKRKLRTAKVTIPRRECINIKNHRIKYIGVKRIPFNKIFKTFTELFLVMLDLSEKWEKPSVYRQNFKSLFETSMTSNLSKIFSPGFKEIDFKFSKKSASVLSKFHNKSF